jgi:DNA-binding NtrC family response regulator
MTPTPVSFPVSLPSSVTRPFGDEPDRAPRTILLFTQDPGLDDLLAETLLGGSAVVLIARNVADALQIVCRRGRDLDLAVLDFHRGCRGMALLAAIHGCYEQLPILVTAAADLEHVQAIACRHGARICLEKPLGAAQLAETIAALTTSSTQLIAA